MPKKKEQPQIFIAPFLVSKAETARLLGDVSIGVVDELIRAGHLQMRTLAGHELVKLDSIRTICNERDPEPIDFPPVAASS